MSDNRESKGVIKIDAQKKQKDLRARVLRGRILKSEEDQGVVSSGRRQKASEKNSPSRKSEGGSVKKRKGVRPRGRNPNDLYGCSLVGCNKIYRTVQQKFSRAGGQEMREASRFPKQTIV